METDEQGWGQGAESTVLWLPNNDRGEGLGSFRPLAMLGEPCSCSRKVAAVHVLMTSPGCESGVFPGTGSPGEETEEFYFLNHWLSGQHICHLVEFLRESCVPGSSPHSLYFLEALTGKGTEECQCSGAIWISI